MTVTVTAIESDPSNIVSVNPLVTPTPTNPPPAVPPAPTALRAQLIQGNRIDIGWYGSTSAATEIEESVMSGPYYRKATLPAGTLHYTTQIRKKTDYRYRVRSVNAQGASGYSNEIIFYTR